MSASLHLIEPDTMRRPVIEPTLPLINIVFLLLIFFLIAGTIQSPISQDVIVPSQSVSFDEVEFTPDEWIYAQSDGSLSFGGEPITESDFGSAMKSNRVVLFADANLRGEKLTKILRALNETGCDQVMIVTAFEADE